MENFMFEFIYDPHTNSLLIIQKTDTSSGFVEIHKISDIFNNTNLTLTNPIVTDLPAKNIPPLKFAIYPSTGNLFVIRRSLQCGQTEIVELDAYNSYRCKGNPIITGLHYIPDNEITYWDFLVNSFGDLFIIKKAGVASTEAHILTATSQYKIFSRNGSTDMHRTDNSYKFLFAPNNDLFVVKKLNTGSGFTELHILSNGNNYSRRDSQLSTGLIQTNEYYFFALTTKKELVIVRKLNAQNLQFGINILKDDSGYKTFHFQQERKVEIDSSSLIKLIPISSPVAIRTVLQPLFWQKSLHDNQYLHAAVAVLGICLFAKGKQLADDPYMAMGVILFALSIAGSLYKINGEYQKAKCEFNKFSSNVQNMIKEFERTARRTTDAIELLSKTSEVVMIELKDEATRTIKELKGEGKEVVKEIKQGIKDGKFKPEAHVHAFIGQMQFGAQFCNIM